MVMKYGEVKKKKRTLPATQVKNVSSFCHTVLILLNSVKAARLLTHPLKHREIRNSPHLRTKPSPQKCFTCSLSRTILSLNLFFPPESNSSAHWLSWRSVTDPRLLETTLPSPAEVMTRNTRTGNSDRCHYSLPSPVGARTIRRGSGPTKLETFLVFEVLRLYRN